MTNAVLKSLLRQACDLLQEERDEIFASHQVGGEIKVTDVFSANAAERVREIDELITAAAIAINEPCRRRRESRFARCRKYLRRLWDKIQGDYDDRDDWADRMGKGE